MAVTTKEDASGVVTTAELVQGVVLDTPPGVITADESPGSHTMEVDRELRDILTAATSSAGSSPGSSSTSSAAHHIAHEVDPLQPHKKRRASSSNTAATNVEQDSIDLSNRRYFCRYCKGSWPISFFRNSQQFGAHCSNCSRKPRSPGSMSAAVGVLPPPLLAAATVVQQQTQQQTTPTILHPIATSLTASAEGSPLVTATPIATGAAAAMFRAMSVTPTGDDDACEMLIAMRTIPTVTAAALPSEQQQPQLSHERSFDEVWTAISANLDELRGRVSHAMADIARCRAMRATAAAAPASTLAQNEAEKQEAAMVALLGEFAAKEQSVRGAARELVTQSAGICCTVARHVAQQQTQMQQQQSSHTVLM